MIYRWLFRYVAWKVARAAWHQFQARQHASHHERTRSGTRTPSPH